MVCYYEAMSTIQSAAIITGGGRGLGRVIAERLSKSYKVLIVGRTEADLVTTCRAIQGTGGVAEYVTGDVKDSESAAKVMKKFGELQWVPSVLVCNAGIGKSGKTHEISTDTWNDIITTNLNGSFYFSRAVLPIFMEKGAGTLCFVSSIAGLEGYAYEAAYVASKHAQVGLSKSIAKEYGKHGIVSVAVCPGFIEGDMTERTIHGIMNRRGVSYDEARRTVAEKNPQKRIISAIEVADVIEYICSHKTPSLNGNPIVLSGGI